MAVGQGRIFPLVDRVLGGKLVEKLRNWRGQDFSHEDIAYMLREQQDIKVSGETVRRWCLEEGVDTPPQEAA